MFLALLLRFINGDEYTMKLAGSKIQNMNKDDLFIGTIPSNHEAFIVSSTPIKQLTIDGVSINIDEEKEYRGYQVRGNSFTIKATEKQTIFVHMIHESICSGSAYYSYGMAYSLDADTFTISDQICFFPISSTKIGYIITKSIGSNNTIYKDITNTMICNEKCEYAYEQIPFVVISGNIQRFKMESVPYKETEFTDIKHGPFVFANSSMVYLNAQPFIVEIKEITRDMITSNAPELHLVQLILSCFASFCFILIIISCVCFSCERKLCYKKRSGTEEYDYRWPFSLEQESLVKNDNDIPVQP